VLRLRSHRRRERGDEKPEVIRVRTPLADIHQAAGANLEEIAGWTAPTLFTTVLDEYNAVRQRVGLLDLSHRGRLQVTGRERVRLLHSLLTNDVQGLAAGSGCPALLLTNKGRLVAMLRVYHGGDFFLLDVEPPATLRVFETLVAYKLSLRAEIEDVTAETAALSLQGQYAHDVLARLAGSDLPRLEREYDHREINLAVSSEETAGAASPIPVRIVRASHTGEHGYDLIMKAGHAPMVWRALLRHGEDYGLQPVGLEALNILRLEAGIPWYGVDLDETTLPLEADVDNAISFTKGCYLGQETIVKIAHRGHVNRRLVGLTVKGEAVPDRGARISFEQADVGRITSAVFSPMLAAVIALGYVKREVSAPGMSLTVRTAAGDLPAEVTALPFLSPSGGSP
jgi:glycine cleavage system T protein